MAKDKERTVNPAAAARKAEKDRARKKGKAAVAAQRTERLARQNPARVERQIADLRAQEASAGRLNTRDQKVLDDLERDLARIIKAKDAGGVSHAPAGQGVKRRWGDRADAPRERRAGGDDSGGETDDSVKKIPMPRDTPPPVPTRRRERKEQGEEREQEAKEEKPVVEAKTVYEAAPVIKDLRKEAAGFVPSAVRRKIDQSKGAGGKLLEAEEMDKLEAQGYGGPGGGAEEAERKAAHVQMEEVPDEAL